MNTPKSDRSPGSRKRETEETDPLLLLDAARIRAIEEIEAASRSWSERAATMHVVEMDLAIQMTACKTAAEVLVICSDWMTKRVVSLVDAQHRMLDIWLHYEAARLAHSVTRQRRNGRLSDGQ
jgi:hypothetical protein